MTLVISEHFYGNELSILSCNLLNYSVLNILRTTKYVINKEITFISFLHASIKLCYHQGFHKLESVLLNYT
jgi:hypothetical protein